MIPCEQLVSLFHLRLVTSILNVQYFEMVNVWPGGNFCKWVSSTAHPCPINNFPINFTSTNNTTPKNYLTISKLIYYL